MRKVFQTVSASRRHISVPYKTDFIKYLLSAGMQQLAYVRSTSHIDTPMI